MKHGNGKRGVCVAQYPLIYNNNRIPSFSINGEKKMKLDLFLILLEPLVVVDNSTSKTDDERFAEEILVVVAQ
jgi:hypothetical protein